MRADEWGAVVKVPFMMQIRVVTSSPSEHFLLATFMPVQSFPLKITVTTHCKKPAAAVLRLLLSVMFRV